MQGIRSADEQDDGQRASTRMIDAVAEEEGVSPSDLDRPLFDAVDPEALDSLVRTDGTDVTVSFTYYGYNVTVTEDGVVNLRQAADA